MPQPIDTAAWLAALASTNSMPEQYAVYGGSSAQAQAQASTSEITFF